MLTWVGIAAIVVHNCYRGWMSVHDIQPFVFDIVRRVLFCIEWVWFSGVLTSYFDDYKIYPLNVLGGGFMVETKYVCPGCGYESETPGSCPNCQKMLVATCSVCGNPIVGEHIHPED